MNTQDMQQTVTEVSRLMKVLSSENRLMILCQLVEGEKSVGTLAGLLGMRDASMSQQLSLLRKDGLVATRREGQAIYYALARDDVARVIRDAQTGAIGAHEREVEPELLIGRAVVLGDVGARGERGEEGEGAAGDG